MKWKLALRIATSPSERWLNKAAEWNPELSSRFWTNRAIGRPTKRWEDDMNEFLKQEFDESENSIESNNQTTKTWINIALEEATNPKRLHIRTRKRPCTQRGGTKASSMQTSRRARRDDMCFTSCSAGVHNGTWSW